MTKTLNFSPPQLSNEKAGTDLKEYKLKMTCLNVVSTLYASEPPSHVNECLNVVSTLVTQDMNLSLMKPISMMEIEKTAFPMGSMGSSFKRIGI